jgi:ATP-binding cassette subfamily C protein CydCD
VKPLDPRLLRHARTARGGVAALALLGAGQAAATLAVAGALTLIVTAHPAGGTPTAALALLAAAFTARAALTWAEQVAAQRTAARVTDELRRSVLAAALRRGPAWVAGFGTGRLAVVLGSGLDALRPWFSGYLPALILGVALPPLTIAVMTLVDPASALVTALTLPLVPIFGALIGWATQRRAQQRWAADARLAGHFLDVVRGLATLRLYGRADRQITVVEQMTDQHSSATINVLRVAFLSSTALDLVGTLSVGLIAVQVGLRVAAGGMALGPALLVILLAPEAYRPLREMAARYHASADAAAVIDDVDAVLTAAPPATAQHIAAERAAAGLAARAMPDAPVTRSGDGTLPPGVVAVGVRVRHPGFTTDALVLPGLAVHAGEIVALRGASGAGKTTTLRVLAGLQEVQAGDVRVAGPRPVYLAQRPTLSHARTVAEVVAIDGETRPGDAVVDAALRGVGLDGEVTGDTPLGEHGGGVSSGQRQRLALARVLREAAVRPVVLLLDEPTAHLDPAAERAVIGRLLDAAARGCAVLVVAHRPALLAAADRVVDVTAPTARAPEMITPARELGAGVPRSTPIRTGRRPATAVALGAASWLAGITLTGAAAWLLVRAATLPPVLTLSTAVVLVRGSAVARPLLRYLERLVAHEVAFARLGAWRSRVYADLVPRVPGPALHRRGDLLTRVVDDVDARVDGLLRGRLPALSTVAVAAVAVGAAALVDPLVALALAGGLTVSGVLAPALAARHAARVDATTGRARARLRDAVVESVDGLEELASRDTSTALAVPSDRSRELSRLQARAARSAGAAAALAHLGWGAAVTMVAATAGRHNAEVAAVLLLAAVALGEPVLTLSDAAAARRRAAGARERLSAIAALPPTVAPVTTTSAMPVSTDLAVRGLVAGWDGRPALDGLDLDLPAGARVAVLGASGSGKSTLAAVLVRLLDPVAGSVTLGGADVRALPTDAVRRRIGLVGDGVDHVFASTVRENLRLARPDADDAELRAVLARVRLTRWLDTLPYGLDTWLGEGGSTVSGGQQRRLATARVLLADPDVLILDEPTEGLDSDTAEALMADLLDAAAGRTVLLLTHRRDGLAHVDEIHDLTDGRLRAPLPR